jgi:hypothetical protein
MYVSLVLQVALALWENILKDRYAHVPLFIDFIRVSACFSGRAILALAVCTDIVMYRNRNP